MIHFGPRLKTQLILFAQITINNGKDPSAAPLRCTEEVNTRAHANPQFGSLCNLEIEGAEAAPAHSRTNQNEQ